MYPIAVNMRGRLAVVIGGGAIAERKIAALLDAGAMVRVVAPSLTPVLVQLSDERRIDSKRKTFEAGDLEGASLVFAATDDDTVNAAVVAAARARGVFVNDASQAERGDFSTPAVHRRNSLTIAVDTSGTSPAVAKLVRERIGALVEHSLSETLVCASRASRLAMTQTRLVMAKLARSGIASTVVNITTKGDQVQDRAITAIGTDNVFVRELELALRDRRADYAVHSCKDLPSTLPDDMEIVAIVERADPRDVFCSDRFESFDALPSGARVGTSSPRRRAQLAAMRGDLEYVTIRGNVDTRLRKLAEREFDAIVLAAAGIDRLGERARYSVPFATERLVPAAAQGALAVETRRDDPLGAILRSTLNDTNAELEVLAERAFMRTMRGGCAAPIGANAVIDAASGSMLVRAAVGLDDGRVQRAECRGEASSIAEAEDLGTALAAEFARASLERTT
ncbi:MAG: hydroxymethylbilane synthase [Vulcanimicrobiaceae bacterium]